jgi:hypothetical protein
VGARLLVELGIPSEEGVLDRKDDVAIEEVVGVFPLKKGNDFL